MLHLSPFLFHGKALSHSICVSMATGHSEYWLLSFTETSPVHCVGHLDLTQDDILTLCLTNKRSQISNRERTEETRKKPITEMVPKGVNVGDAHHHQQLWNPASITFLHPSLTDHWPLDKSKVRKLTGDFYIHPNGKYCSLAHHSAWGLHIYLIQENFAPKPQSRLISMLIT